MNRWLMIAAAVGGVGIILVAVLLTHNRLPGAEQIADRMQAEIAQVETVQGRVQLTAGDAVLEQELWVQVPGQLRSEIEVGPPGVGPTPGGQKTTLVLNQESAWFYNPSLEIVTVADRADVQSGTGLMAGTSLLETMPRDVLRALRQGAVQVLGEETVAGREAIAVQITTAPEVTPFGGSRLTVWLDRVFFYPLAIESDSGLSLRFQVIAFNAPIDPVTFDFVPPPGVPVNRVEDGQ